jgi:hypothetical protein
MLNSRLRWIAFLPAAWLGGVLFALAGQLVGRAVLQLLAPDASPLYLLQLTHVLIASGFVVTGALVAPRRQVTVALALAGVRVFLSLLIHVLGQSNPGILNYIDFGLETFGAVAGSALIFGLRRGSQPGMHHNRLMTGDNSPGGR